METPEIHLGLSPTRKRTEPAKRWREIAVCMATSKNGPATVDLGEFLGECLLIYPDPVPVTIRVDDYHAELIYKAISANGKKAKVKA